MTVNDLIEKCYGTHRKYRFDGHRYFVSPDEFRSCYECDENAWYAEVSKFTLGGAPADHLITITLEDPNYYPEEVTPYDFRGY